MTSQRVCFLTVLAALPVCARAGASGNAAAKVDELFRPAIRQAKATPGFDDDVSLAQKLLAAARADSRDAATAGALCQAAWELASAAPEGLEVAADAMALRARRQPARAAECTRQVLEIRRRQYRSAAASQRPRAGRRLLGALEAVADALAKENKHSEAISYLRQAASVAAAIHSARQKDIQAEIKRLTALQRIHQVVTYLNARLVRTPADGQTRRRLVNLHLIELDDPAAAGKLLGRDDDEVLRTYIPLATKETAELKPGACLELGNWYYSLKAKATTDIGKPAMLLRARGYFETYLDTVDPNDLTALKTKLMLEKIEKELEQLAPAQAPGKWIDLLAKVDPSKHSVSGRWWRRGSSLAAKTYAADRVLIPVAPKGDYEMKVQFARLDGNSEVNVILPVGGTSVVLMLGHGRERVSGLSHVGGEYCSENATRSPGRLTNRTAHTVTVKITTEDKDGRLQATLDGKKLLDWKGPQSDLTCPREWALPDRSAVGLGSYGGNTVTFTSAKLRMLSGETVKVAYARRSERDRPDFRRLMERWRDRNPGSSGRPRRPPRRR